MGGMLGRSKGSRIDFGDVTFGQYGLHVDRVLLGESDFDPELSLWHDGESYSSPSDEFVEGFVDAAQDVWNEVEGEL